MFTLISINKTSSYIYKYNGRIKGKSTLVLPSPLLIDALIWEKPFKSWKLFQKINVDANYRPTSKNLIHCHEIILHSLSETSPWHPESYPLYEQVSHGNYPHLWANGYKSISVHHSTVVSHGPQLCKASWIG